MFIRLGKAESKDPVRCPVLPLRQDGDYGDRECYRPEQKKFNKLHLGIQYFVVLMEIIVHQLILFTELYITSIKLFLHII